MRLLYVMQHLKEHTDEAHAATLNDMVEALQRQGISCDRKSLYADMEALRCSGMDIVLTKGQPVCLFLGQSAIRAGRNQDSDRCSPVGPISHS